MGQGLIEQTMKRTDILHIRISRGGRWMYFDHGPSEWVVLERPYRARENRTLYNGPDLQAALTALIAD